MKRLWFLFIGSVLLLPALHAAAVHTCSSPDQIMFRLYDYNNSHVANASDLSAGYQVCYDELFGQAYVAGAGGSAWQCNGANILFNITASKNAHAGQVNASGHSLGVCYGDLSCRTTAAACGPTETQVGSLSALANAHAGIAGTLYPYKICCTQVISGGGIGAVYWANAADPGLHINKSSVNRTVALVAETTAADNTLITFSIYEDDPVFDDDLTSGKITTGSLPALTLGGRAVALWKISDADIQAGGEEQISEFYFNASTTTSSNTSDVLYANKTRGPDAPPRARICSPEHRQIYFVDKEVRFEDCSLDDGLIVRTQWSIEEDAYYNESKALNHTFTTSGQKTITLRVTDEAGQQSETQIALLLIKSMSNESILAFINKPAHKELVRDDTQSGVIFSANESYVINTTVACVAANAVGEIICLAGMCPSITQTPPPGCNQNITLAGALDQGFASLYFNWTFDDGWNFGGFNNVSNRRIYDLYSAQFNDKWISLLVRYQTTALQKRTWRNFTLVGIRQCLLNEAGGKFINLDQNGLILEEVDINAGGCVGNDGLAGSNDDCCPAGWQCKQGIGPGGVAQCSFNSSSPSACGDYRSVSTCLNDSANVADNPNNPEWVTPPEWACGTIRNGSVVNCGRCVWRTPTSGQAGCFLNKTLIPLPGGSICSEGSCYTRSSGGPIICGEDGFFIFSDEVDFAQGTCSGLNAQDLGCASGTYRVPCRGKLELPLMAGWGLFVASLLIIAISLLLYLKKCGRNSYLTISF